MTMDKLRNTFWGLLKQTSACIIKENIPIKKRHRSDWNSIPIKNCDTDFLWQTLRRYIVKRAINFTGLAAAATRTDQFLNNIFPKPWKKRSENENAIKWNTGQINEVWAQRIKGTNPTNTRLVRSTTRSCSWGVQHKIKEWFIPQSFFQT